MWAKKIPVVTIMPIDSIETVPSVLHADNRYGEIADRSLLSVMEAELAYD
jgi:hypothetical protein